MATGDDEHDRPASHSHSGTSHLLGMAAAGAVVLVVLLAAGRSLGEALPLAALLAFPLMMIGMLFMMRRGQEGTARPGGGAEADRPRDAHGASWHGGDDRPVLGRLPTEGTPDAQRPSGALTDRL